MTYTLITLTITARTVHGLNGPETITDTQTEPHGTVYREGNVCLVAGSGAATMAQVEAALPGIRQWKERYLRDLGAEKLEAIAQPYSRAERETWFIQREEAKSGGATPYCDAIASKRGIDRKEFLKKVTENMNLFSVASADILGQQQALIDRAYAETDLSTFVTIGWE